MQHVTSQDHSDSPNAEKIKKTCSRCLELQPCTASFHSNQSQMMLPCMRLIPPMESLKQAEVWLPAPIHGEHMLHSRTDLPLRRCLNSSQSVVYPWLHLWHQKWPFLWLKKHIKCFQASIWFCFQYPTYSLVLKIFKIKCQEFGVFTYFPLSFLLWIEH